MAPINSQRSSSPPERTTIKATQGSERHTQVLVLLIMCVDIGKRILAPIAAAPFYRCFCREVFPQQFLATVETLVIKKKSLLEIDNDYCNLDRVDYLDVTEVEIDSDRMSDWEEYTLDFSEPKARWARQDSIHGHESQSFSRFSELPAELRYGISGFALPSEQMEARIIEPYALAHVNERSRPSLKYLAVKFALDKRYPVHFAVNKEARREAARIVGGEFIPLFPSKHWTRDLPPEFANWLESTDPIPDQLYIRPHLDIIFVTPRCMKDLKFDYGPSQAVSVQLRDPAKSHQNVHVDIEGIFDPDGMLFTSAEIYLMKQRDELRSFTPPGARLQKLFVMFGDLRHLVMIQQHSDIGHRADYTIVS
ncbi:hypothetical protein BCR34DRAFT_619615 [Clohesyomyces aquaticus]|uniref:2EXR domain-containing protein n=1 Tax=Clohesyomyces aquaticus TaxID=1231657 RepID=A0A1Y1YFA7_9PLEO|nr:hypothetical protein BCR34DRAFT_619615 [Clohesyomyces aquaticus]